MGRIKNYFALIAFFACSGSMTAQNYFDDIYYNPKKSKDVEVVTTKKQPEQKSYYISDMANMDVDAYNRRGQQYYASSVDTIGRTVENGEDFVYTQQIQKYYNPTIVVDNANALGDILSNAYGNVDIVINNNGIPVFSPWYGYNWAYSSLYSPWSWGFNIGPWGWNIGYDPWYAWGPGWNWGWGPSWNWGWNWGWNPGPVWGPGPGWGPGWGPGPRPPMASWRPRGNTTVGPRPGWSGNTRPPQMAGASRNPGRAPVVSNPANRPGTNIVGGRPAGVVNNNGKWEYNTTNTTGHRQAGTGVLSGGQHRTQPTVNTNKTNNRNNTVNRNSNTQNNRNTYRNNNSYNTNRSTGFGNSFGGGRSVGGGGRSTGGGGGRHR